MKDPQIHNFYSPSELEVEVATLIVLVNQLQEKVLFILETLAEFNMIEKKE